MVNTKIISRYQGGEGDPPAAEGAELKINTGPLYLPQDVFGILKSTNDSFIAWTKTCTADLQKWGLDDDDVKELIRLALNNGRFIGSEWCVQNPNGPWAACDAYAVTRKEWLPHARKEMDCEYYIKFAIGINGNVLLLVSCHPPRDRR